uniref:Uncharacterized protein n=1 Tax=Leersia perrieri TaxID=77586 RepID=A0A0D9VW59_9ORYZ
MGPGLLEHCVRWAQQSPPRSLVFVRVAAEIRLVHRQGAEHCIGSAWRGRSRTRDGAGPQCHLQHPDGGGVKGWGGIWEAVDGGHQIEAGEMSSPATTANLCRQRRLR